MKTILEHAIKLNLTDLAAVLENNLQNNIPTFIHLTCRDKLRNQSRPRSRLDINEPDLSKRPARRSDVGDFDFKAQCFYCEKTCTPDFRHPYRNIFEVVSTKDTKIYSGSLKICSKREDTYAKNIERRLLSVCDLVVAEANYHPVCRSNFENSLPKHTSRGRPSSTEKLESFETVCKFLEDEMELITLAEFQTMMMEQHTNAYSVKMTKIKLKERYQDQIQFVSRCGKSDILLLSNVNSILNEAWYQNRKLSQDEEVERIIETAAKLIKIDIKNHEHVTNVYPTKNFIKDKKSNSVPSTLKTFIGKGSNKTVISYASQICSLSSKNSNVFTSWFSCRS